MEKEWPRLLNEGNSLKNIGRYNAAIECYNKAMDIVQKPDYYRCQAHAEAGMASCYRALKRPLDAIALLHKRYRGITSSSIGLLISVAAAYCDIGDYVYALYCIDTAWAKMHEPRTIKNNRSNVIYTVKARILKESGKTARELRELRDPDRYR